MGEQAGGGRAEDANSFTGSDQDMCRGRMEDGAARLEEKRKITWGGFGVLEEDAKGRVRWRQATLNGSSWKTMIVVKMCQKAQTVTESSFLIGTNVWLKAAMSQ